MSGPASVTHPCPNTVRSRIRLSCSRLRRRVPMWPDFSGPTLYIYFIYYNTLSLFRLGLQEKIGHKNRITKESVTRRNLNRSGRSWDTRQVGSRKVTGIAGLRAS